MVYNDVLNSIPDKIKQKEEMMQGGGVRKNLIYRP